MTTTYKTWTQTSSAYRAYLTASRKCAELFANLIPASTATAAIEPREDLKCCLCGTPGPDIQRTGLNAACQDCQAVGLNTVIEARTPLPRLSKWVHPGNGEVRYYINNMAKIVGLEYSQYKTGNISGATLNGETISNSEATRIYDMFMFGKIWVHTDGTLGYKAINGTRDLHKQEIFDRVNNALAVHGLREDIRKGLI